MSVAMGLHQAVGLAAGTLSTFLALASRAPDPHRPVLAVVRALRSEWYVQTVHGQAEPPVPAERWSDSQLLRITDTQIVGFGLRDLKERSSASPELPWISPGPLAEAALQLADSADWRPQALTTPAYLAPPPVYRRRVPEASS